MCSADELGLLSKSDIASSSTTEENEDEFFVFSDQVRLNYFHLIHIINKSSGCHTVKFFALKRVLNVNE